MDIDLNQILYLLQNDPITLVSVICSYLFVRAKVGEGAKDSEVKKHKKATSETQEYSNVVSRALDCVIKAIEMSENKKAKEIVTELSKTDPGVRDIIIKAVDRRKTADDIDRGIMAPSEHQ